MVREHVPGQYLAAECTLDLDEDLFLHDHTLGRNIAQLDDSLLALPIVPLTVSMEMLAEAAAHLLPDQVFVGMRDVRAHRWILLEESSRTLRVVARRREAAGPPQVEVTLWEADGEGERGSGTPILEGTMLFAQERPTPPVATPFSLREPRPSRWSSTRVYAEGMFHGPAFRAITGVEQCGADGAVATMQALPVDDFFRSGPTPAFVAEPVLLDAAGQLIGLWTLETLEDEFVVFPYRMEVLALYGPPFQPGESLICRARSTLLAGSRVTSDIELIDEHGHLRARLTGWEDKRFRLSRRLYRYILEPSSSRLSEPWATPLAGTTDPGRYRCCRIGQAEHWQQQFAFWEKVIAHLVLSRREREAWRSLTGPERRRQSWLLGRIAAKEAVISLLAAHGGPSLAPADVEIVADARGRPTVQGRWLGQVDAAVIVSIAHTDGLAVAVAGFAEPGAGLGLGVDVEPIRRREQSFAQLAFTAEEQRLLAELEEAHEGEEWALRLWCAKEAVGKAIGHGLASGLHSIVARRVGAETGSVWLELAAGLSQQIPALDGQLIRARTALDDEAVVASVLNDRAALTNRV